MRKYLFSAIVAVGFICFVAYSCSREDAPSDSGRPLPKTIDLGAEHNACVEFVFDKLNARPRTRTGAVALSKEEAKAVAKESTKEFVAKNYSELEAKVKSQVDEYIEQVIDGKIPMEDHVVYSALTPGQKVLAEKLDAVFMDDDTDLESLENRITAIQSEAEATLSGDELEAVLAGCYVASYTLRYWHDNFSEWSQLVPNDPGKPTVESFSWKWLGKEDAKGAIATATGGLGGTLIGCGPVGWTGWAVVVFSGAAGASIANVIDQLWP